MNYDVTQVKESEPFLVDSSSAPAPAPIWYLPKVRAARKFLPSRCTETSFQRYDGTDFYQWHWRDVYWYPCGPVFRIAEAKLTKVETKKVVKSVLSPHTIGRLRDAIAHLDADMPVFCIEYGNIEGSIKWTRKKTWKQWVKTQQVGKK